MKLLLASKLYFRFFARYFDKLRPLLFIDPMLQYSFTYVCPRKDLSHLIRYLSPYLGIAVIIKRLQDKNEAGTGYWVIFVTYSYLLHVTI